MMIIFGLKTTESTAATGMFPCPRCQTPQAYRHIAHNRWFSIYFIPILPLGRLGEQVECQACFSRFNPDVLSGHADEPVMAILIDGQDGPQHTVPPRTSQLPRTSSLATASMILGLISPVFLCACGLSVLPSLAAIITGHMARFHIKRSTGRLAGKGMATAGLAFGYPLLLISVAYLAWIGSAIRHGWQIAEQRPAGQQAPWLQTAADRLDSAEARVRARGKNGPASGNSPEAKQLAEEYAQVLTLMREVMFTEDADRILSLTGGDFLVHCELHQGRCLFLVHVPSYRDYTKDAEQLLETTAWQLAQETVLETMDAEDTLAVGLRGAILYGAVLVGPAGADQSHPDNFTRAERDDLLAFFPDDGGRPMDSAIEAAPAIAEREEGALDGSPLIESLPTMPASAGPAASQETAGGPESVEQLDVDASPPAEAAHEPAAD